MTPEERAKVSHFLKGHGVTNPPLWLVLLDAAKGDPLQAMHMEAELNQVWWERYMVYRDELGREMKAQQAKVQRGKRKA